MRWRYEFILPTADKQNRRPDLADQGQGIPRVTIQSLEPAQASWKNHVNHVADTSKCILHDDAAEFGTVLATEPERYGTANRTPEYIEEVAFDQTG